MSRLIRVALTVAACALVYDAARPAARQVSARAAIAGIHLYQRTLSPALAGGGAMCRFTPTCSRYAEAVIARDGIVRGGWLAVWRIARCGPWTPAGTEDWP
ncbi:MAG: membrane protein insertion efficiency factor YidD [Vicinamibacterales bacterium]